MDKKRWGECYQQLADLEKSKNQDWSKVVEICQELTTLNLPDLERAIAWINAATAYGHLNQPERALDCLDHAIALEDRHHRRDAREQKAVFFANHQRPAEALGVYRELSQRKDLFISDIERIAQNIKVLEGAA